MSENPEKSGRSGSPRRLSRRTVVLCALGVGAGAAAGITGPRVVSRVADVLGLSGPVLVNPSVKYGARLAGVPDPVPSFGPNGTHWPLSTPWITGAVDYEQTVDCTWQALSEAITTAIDSTAEDVTVRLLLKPGVLEGYGSASGSEPALADIGSLERSTRVLVYPRDGYGSVTVDGSWRWSAVYGVAFGGVVTSGGFLATGCSGSAFARMKVASGYNVYGRDRLAYTEDIELVELVVPESQLRDQDISAFRTPTSDVGGLRRITRSGCYSAPAYKRAGSDAHCDTLQMSGQRDNYYGEFASIDCVDFASTNAAIQIGNAPDLSFDHCLVLGGDAGKARYPLLAGSDDGGNHHAFNGSGAPAGCSAKNSLFIGPMGAATWSTVSDTTVLYASTGTAPEDGEFIVDASLANWSEREITDICPRPTEAYLTTVWN